MPQVEGTTKTRKTAILAVGQRAGEQARNGGRHRRGKMTDQTKIRKIQEGLQKLFPTLNPGLILFELDIPISRSPNWEEVNAKALEYTKRYNPELTHLFEEQ